MAGKSSILNLSRFSPRLVIGLAHSRQQEERVCSYFSKLNTLSLVMLLILGGCVLLMMAHVNSDFLHTPVAVACSKVMLCLTDAMIYFQGIVLGLR